MHRANMSGERAQARHRGELALADAVEKLEPKYVEHSIQKYEHIQEDAGNDEARASWQTPDPPWKRAKVGRCLWRPQKELCVSAPRRNKGNAAMDPPASSEKPSTPAGDGAVKETSSSPIWTNVPPNIEVLVVAVVLAL